MRHFPTIISHEIRSLLYSASTYIAAVLFLLVMSFFFVLNLEDYTKLPRETAPAVEFFKIFWIPVLFMVPLLTMRSLAEERRLGTLETLLTTSVSTTEVVLGKFFAAYLLYLLLWGSTLGFHYILHYYAGDSRLLAPGPLIGGYLFITVSGLLYIGVGIFASSLTRSQSVAAIISFVTLLGLIFGTRYVATAQFLNQESLHTFKSTAESTQVFQHLADFTNGIIDTRQIIYYVSGSILALIFSILGVEYKLLEG
jgi:ABC-2 type transport system permease protein